MLEDVLAGIGQEETGRMQEKVVELIPASTLREVCSAGGWPHLFSSHDFQDAFDLGVAGLTRHIREHRDG